MLLLLTNPMQMQRPNDACSDAYVYANSSRLMHLLLVLMMVMLNVMLNAARSDTDAIADGSLASAAYDADDVIMTIVIMMMVMPSPYYYNTKLMLMSCFYYMS